MNCLDTQRVKLMILDQAINALYITYLNIRMNPESKMQARLMNAYEFIH